MKTKLIILGFVVIIGGLGLWVTKNQTASVVSTSDWKTYTTPNKLFSFDYPPTWFMSAVVREKFGGQDDLTWYVSNLKELPLPTTASFVLKDGQIMISFNTSGTNQKSTWVLDDFLKGCSSKEYLECKKVTINGIEFVRSVFLQNSKTQKATATILTALVNGGMYSFGGYTLIGPDESKQIAEMDKVFNTIKINSR